jgi:ornithine carbamoyltransferase
MVKDFVTFLDYTEAEITALLDLTDTLREAWHAGQLPKALTGKSLALIWDAEGFRNRVSFELGITRLGGVAVRIPGRLDMRESIEDVARYLDNWFDGIVSRTQTWSHMQRLAAASAKPVINARTDFNHPCEILSDLAYVRSTRGSLDGLKVVFVGEATNLCHPWFAAAARLPIEVVQVCPEGYAVSDSFLASARENAVGSLRVSHDLEHELESAGVVYTDCWPSRACPDDDARVAKLFLPYQVTAKGLRSAPYNVLFLPCPPVTRGEEVSDDALSDFGDHVYAAKEYLLHAQNAVLVTLIS